MIARFCLYGFLKNQRYFEPFLVLIFLDRGLSFFAIGALLALRAISTNVLELVSGAVADTWGRRRSMIASFSAYLGAFAILGLTRTAAALAVGMVLFGVGDAFRSGTHKAMILTWLRANDRQDERSKIYGLTRSWSKLGSAASVVAGATWVVLSGDMDALFLLALAPYVLGLINLATYPALLEGEVSNVLSVRAAFDALKDAVDEVRESPALRRLVVESSGFMGVFTATKDYLQPVLQAVAAAGFVAAFASAVAGGSALDDAQRTALLVGPVYLALFLLSAVVSRQTHRLVAWAGGERAAAGRIWIAFVAAFALLGVGSLPGATGVAIFGFVILYGLEAVWRPVIVSRFDEHGSEHLGATLLSIESQARTLTAAVLAPAVGLCVDWATGSGLPAQLPLAILGAGVGVLFGARSRILPKPIT